MGKLQLYVGKGARDVTQNKMEKDVLVMNTPTSALIRRS
jgi:hypothetical protein